MSPSVSPKSPGVAALTAKGATNANPESHMMVVNAVATEKAFLSFARPLWVKYNMFLI